MKRVLLTISYDGSAYHGWQVQPNAVTVQETLQDALEKLLGVKTGATGCSRTDAGVHAREFCCHIDCDDAIPDEAFLKGLNALLPDDIGVRAVRSVKSDFHARYDCRGKEYIYYINNTADKDPFLFGYSWNIERKLNIDKMNDFCKRMVGKHDFYAFSSSGRTVETTVRTVTECYVEKKGNMVELHISADGFLYNMVRIIVGTAVAVSDGRIDPRKVEDIFLSRQRDKAGATAPARGLFLNKVYYDVR